MTHEDIVKALRICATGECCQVPGADGFPTCGCDDISGQASDAITALIARAEKAEGERDAAIEIIDSIHRSLDCADLARGKCSNHTELAISNGLALGRIAIRIKHEYKEDQPNAE